MVAWGILIFSATLFTGWWATIAYRVTLASIAASHLDAWYRDLSPGKPISGLAPDVLGGNLTTGGTVAAA